MPEFLVTLAGMSTFSTTRFDDPDPARPDAAPAAGTSAPTKSGNTKTSPRRKLPGSEYSAGFQHPTPTPVDPPPAPHRRHPPVFPVLEFVTIAVAPAPFLTWPPASARTPCDAHPRPRSTFASLADEKRKNLPSSDGGAPGAR